MDFRDAKVKLLDERVKIPGKSAVLLEFIAKTGQKGEGVFETGDECQGILRRLRLMREIVDEKSSKKVIQKKNTENMIMNEKMIREREEELKKLAFKLENPVRAKNAKEKEEKSWFSKVFNW